MVMPPLNPQQLLDASDIAGEAIVKKVVQDSQGRAVARLRFTRIRKGFWRLLLARTVSVALRSGSTGSADIAMPGSWTDGYAPGTVVFTHLKWDDEYHAYRTTHWNAVRELRRA